MVASDNGGVDMDKGEWIIEGCNYLCKPGVILTPAEQDWLFNAGNGRTLDELLAEHPEWEVTGDSGSEWTQIFATPAGVKVFRAEAS
jgi:hypothetical protein